MGCLPRLRDFGVSQLHSEGKASGLPKAVSAYGSIAIMMAEGGLFAFASYHRATCVLRSTPFALRLISTAKSLQKRLPSTSTQLGRGRPVKSAWLNVLS